MLKKFGLFFATLTTPLVLAPTANAYCEVQQDSRVAQIDIIIKKAGSVEAIDIANIKAQLKTKEGGLFSQIDFDNDLKALSQEYDRVEPHLQFVNNQVFITLDIWARPTIHALCFQGNENVSSRKLQKEMGLCPGNVFDRQAFIEAFHKLKSYYVKHGYFESELEYQLTPVEGTNEVDITICIQEGRSGKIKKILFDGLCKKEERDLLEMIHTKKYDLFTSWFTQTGTYQQELLEHDRLIIVNYLQNEGYADAQVDIQIEEAPEDNRILICVKADKGEPYTFGTLTIKGNTIFTDEQVFSRFKICEGSTFSPDALRATVQAISTLYGTCGYIESSVHFQPSLVENEPVYNVSFEITEGEQYRVGLIKVFGNTHTQPRVILHECLLVPGDVFDSRKLQATEERLHNIQYFKNVNVYPVKSPDEKLLGANYRDVHIEVEEDSTGNLSAFFGFSTLDSLFGGIEVMERNFNYKGLFSMFKDGPNALRGGGEYLQLKAMLGTKTANYMLRWVKPYFLDSKWVAGFDIEKAENKVVSRDYDIETAGGRLHATYPVNAYVNFNWNYRLRWSHTHVRNTSNPLIIAEASRGGWISSSGISLTYTRLDNLYKTSDGFRSELSVEAAGLGGEYKYVTLSYINTLYVPAGRKGVLKFRGDLRYLQPLPGSKIATYVDSNGQVQTLSRADSLPLSERFFLGGDTSVRGYNGFSIGPKFPGSNDPKGGISSLLLSEEYLYHLFKKVDAFVFVDAGAISDQEFTIGTLRASAGYGLRVELFNNIPIIFGMGYPINPASPSDVRRFFVSLGGRF